MTVESWEGIRKIVSRKTNFRRASRVARGRQTPRALPRRARERLSELAAERDLVALVRAARRRGGSAWIVGGALRDLALGRDVPEVDVAVEGDAGEIARDLASSVGARAVLLSGEKRPRVFRVAGRARIIDVADLEGGAVETDLARRDFTVNAIAAEISALEILDPHFGLADLAARRLRMVRESNLTSDPLRALRAARLMATHGLLPDARTSAACRRAAPALSRVARERVQAEIAKLLEARRAAPALTWAARAELLAPALDLPLPERARVVARSLQPFDRDAVSRLPPARRRRLRLALLAGRLGFSGGEASAWLRRLRWARLEADEVGRLLALAAAARGASGGDAVWRWVLEAGELAADALRLLEALDPGSRGLARRLRSRASRRRPVPDVRGADVLEWTGVGPGPRVGLLLEGVRVEALAGRLRTREQARDWLRAHADPAGGRPGR